MKEPVNIPFDEVSDNVADYVNMRIASTKLALVEGLSNVTGGALRLLALVLFCWLALMAFAAAAILWLGELIGSYIWGAVIVGVFCLIVGIILYAVKGIFVNPMVKLFSGMFFSPRKNKDDED